MDAKKTLGKILLYGSFLATMASSYNCSSTKNLAIGETKQFKNQELTFEKEWNFRHYNTTVDSSSLQYHNKNKDVFLIRIPKEEKFSTYQKIKNIKKMSFTAKKSINDKYTIDIKTIRPVTNN